MTSRAIERQIADFVDFIDSHLARLIEVFQQRTRRMYKAERDRVIRDALVIAFRSREKFDPRLESAASWFLKIVREAIYENVVTDDVDRMMLNALSAPRSEITGVWIDETGSLPSQLAGASSDEGAGAGREPVSRPKADAIQKPGKECPPCWRCRYFDGWLPRGVPLPSVVKMDPGIADACAALDARKIAIAQYVRGEYPAELLED